MSVEPAHHDTLIAFTSESTASGGVLSTKGVAAFQCAPLDGHPCELTQADVLFRTAYRSTPSDPDTRHSAHWDAVSARPRACLRASPPRRTYGWGLHCDPANRGASLPVDSLEYRQLMTDPRVKVGPALRLAHPRATP